MTAEIATMPGTLPPSFRVGGVKISAVTRQSAIEQFHGMMRSRGGGYVTVTGAHGVVEAQADAHLMAIFEGARMALPDGMPVYWAGRFLQGQSMSRVPGTEFFDAVLSDPRAPKFRHFFYGSHDTTTREVARRAAEALGEDAVAGWHCPPMRPAGSPEDAQVVADIQATRPDVIWVGLSTPKQEYWMANHARHFPATMLVGIGAAFDFYAGIKDRGPAAMSNSGFEWLYRMVREPKRLWPRYRTVVPVMLSLLVRDGIARATRGAPPPVAAGNGPGERS